MDTFNASNKLFLIFCCSLLSYSASTNAEAVGEWVQCVGVTPDRTKYAIINGFRNKEQCFATANKCASNITATYHSSPVIINAPYIRCTETVPPQKCRPYPSCAESKPKIRVSFTQHMKWVLDHEKRRGIIQRFRNMDEFDDIRGIYWNEQEHNKSAQAMISAKSNSELSLVLESLGIIKEEGFVPPEVIEFDRHMLWVLDHKNQRHHVQNYRDWDDYQAIRGIYKHHQKHNPLTARAIDYISNAEVNQTLARLGVYKKSGKDRPEVREFNLHLRWVMDQKGQRGAIQNNLNWDDYSAIRNIYKYHQKHNPHFAAAINYFSDDDLKQVLAKMGVRKQSGEHLAEVRDFHLHMKWVLDHKKQRPHAQIYINRNDLGAVRDMYKHHQKHNPHIAAAINYFDNDRLIAVLAGLGVKKQ